MGMCVFQTEPILRLAQHAIAAPNHEMGYESANDPEPALLFVHDQGVYLMSNGIPRDTDAVNNRAHVVYAAGCDPNEPGASFDDWYGTSRDLVGGDDFVEVLPLGDAELFLENCRAFSEFIVEISPKQLDATFRKRRRSPRREESPA